MGRALLLVAVAAGLKVVARLCRERLPYQTGNTGLWSLPLTPGHSSSQGRKSSAVTAHWLLLPAWPSELLSSTQKACLGAVCTRYMLCVHSVCAVCMYYMLVNAICIGSVCVLHVVCALCVYAVCMNYAHACAICIGSVCAACCMRTVNVCYAHILCTPMCCVCMHCMLSMCVHTQVCACALTFAMWCVVPYVYMCCACMQSIYICCARVHSVLRVFCVLPAGHIFSLL